MTATSRILPVGAARRWDSLDALRGAAAFLVLTFHIAQASTGFAARSNPLVAATWLDPWSWMKFTPLRLFVSSGPSAVVLFFALSGFVLSLPFLRAHRQPGYLAFAVRRVCRIFPPFAFAVLVSAALYAFVRPTPVPELSHWFNTVLWDQPLSADYVLRNLMMTGQPQDMTLDLVMWSLVHELRISLVFPLLFMMTRRAPWTALAGSILVSVACTAALGGREADSVALSLVDTGRFLFLFVIGIVMAIRMDDIRHAIGRLPGWAALALTAASVAIMLAPGPSVWNGYNFVWGIGAASLMAVAIGSSRVERFLSAAPLVWLGRVSYSLYLIHLPLLIAALHLGHGIVPFWLTAAGVVVLSLLCADLMYRTVEMPSIRLGRFLTASRQPSADAAATTPMPVAPR